MYAARASVDGPSAAPGAPHRLWYIMVSITDKRSFEERGERFAGPFGVARMSRDV